MMRSHLIDLAIVAASAGLIPCASAQTPASAPAVIRQAGKLTLRKPVERELGPAQTDVFTVDVADRQFLHVEVVKKGVDVVVALADPEGKPLVTADSPSLRFGPDPVSLVAGRAGEYQIQVAKSSRSSETGWYRIELTALRSPGKQDWIRLKAEAEFFATVANDRSEDKQKWRKAIDGYQRATALWHALRDPREPICLHSIGRIYWNFRESHKALQYYQQALPLYRAWGNRAGEATTLLNVGTVQSAFAEHQKALDYYHRALLLWRALADGAGEAATISGIGIVYMNLGENQKALEYFDKAARLFRAVGDDLDEAKAVINIGVVYADLGENHKALEYYNQALPTIRAVDNTAEKHRLEAIALGNIGKIYSTLDENSRALEYFDQVLSLYRALGNPVGEAEMLKSIGEVYSDVGEKRKALDYFNQALLLERPAGSRVWEADTLNEMGKVYSDLGEKEKALQNYNKALQVARAVSEPSIVGEILSNLLRYWQADGYPGLAIFFGKQAVNQYENLRRNIRGLDRQLQRTYLATVSDLYRRLADLLIAQSRLAEAEQVLSLLKEQEYFDYVRRDAAEASSVNGGATLNRDETECDRLSSEVADKLVAMGTERSDLIDLIAKRTLTSQETKRLDQLEKYIAVGEAKFEQFIAGLPARFSVEQKPLSDLRETEGLGEDLRELPPGSVVIVTLVGEDKFRAILRTPDVEKAYEYPIKAVDLNLKAEAFRQVVTDPSLDPRPLAEELYKIVVAPMAEDLRQAKAQTLMWSLDGALRYLPLAALYDGQHYLIEQYRLSVITLASRTRLKDRPNTQWKAAGFGTTKSYEGTAALPEVSSELTGIIVTKPGGPGVFVGEIKLDDQFTQQTMRQTLRKRYPVIHIASHFRFQPGNEMQSYLLLGDGGHLSIAELRTSALFGGVQLLTLSACNTAMGDGAEVESFGELAQRQGAKAVIASLWQVADVSTSRLMQEFYRIRESSPGMPKLEALREAQLALLHGDMKDEHREAAARGLVHDPENSDPKPTAPPFIYDPKKPFAHPYYWAPFFLMGNWL